MFKKTKTTHCLHCSVKEIEPLFVVSVGSSLQLRRNIINSEQDNSDIETLDDIFLNSDGDMEQIIDKLSELHGQWPFKDKSTCETMKTLDKDYHRYKRRGRPTDADDFDIN